MKRPLEEGAMAWKQQVIDVLLIAGVTFIASSFPFDDWGSVLRVALGGFMLAVWQDMVGLRPSR